MTPRCRPECRPTAVSCSAPQPRLPDGVQSPRRPRVSRYQARCPLQKTCMNQRGGRRTARWSLDEVVTSPQRGPRGVRVERGYRESTYRDSGPERRRPALPNYDDLLGTRPCSTEGTTTWAVSPRRDRETSREVTGGPVAVPLRRRCWNDTQKPATRGGVMAAAIVLPAGRRGGRRHRHQPLPAQLGPRGVAARGAPERPGHAHRRLRDSQRRGSRDSRVRAWREPVSRPGSTASAWSSAFASSATSRSVSRSAVSSKASR